MALNPVGPQPRSVYWRRRLLLLLAVLVVVFLVSRACGSGEAVRATPTPGGRTLPLAATSGVPASAASVASTAGRAGTPSPATSPASTAAGHRRTAGPGTSAATAGMSASPDASTSTGVPAATPPAASGTPAATPAPTASPTPATDQVAACTDAEVKVTAKADSHSYPAGTTPRLTLTVRNVSSAACQRDLGSAALELFVTSGSAGIWNSDACKAKGSSAVTTLAPGESSVTRLSWPRVRSGSSCPTPRPTAEPGTYRVAGRAGTARSAPAAFVLR